ncbi:MAG: hypothetical protein HQK77_19550 [Desulfobacterales bacterium]|nr:hypothetical protein [Desulfobacterales bacterium]
MKKNVLAKLLMMIGLIWAQPASSLEYMDFGHVDIHGFLTQGYMQSDKNNFFSETEDGTLQFHEYGLNFSSEVTSNLRLGMQFFARDLGQIGNDEINVDWAYADYHYKDWLSMRVGKVKFPIGLYNKIRDMDMLRTWIILPQSIYNEAWRDIVSGASGFQLYGSIPFAGMIQYQGMFSTFEMKNNSGISLTIEDNIPFPFQIEVQKNKVDNTYIGSLTWDTPISGLRLGQSYYQTSLDSYVTHHQSVGATVDPILQKPITDSSGNFELYSWKQTGNQATLFNPSTKSTAYGTVINDPSSGKDVAIVLDPNNPFYFQTIAKIVDSGNQGVIRIKSFNMTSSIEYSWGEWIFDLEYASQKYNLKLQDLSEEEFYSLGYYAGLSYRLNEWMQLGGYYSEYYRDDEDKKGKKSWETPILGNYRSWLKDSCLTLRFDFNEFWTLKLEGHQMNGAAWLLNADNLDDHGQPRYDKDWFLFATKLSYYF